MKIALPALAMLLAATVHAADAPRKYGILSLAGDSFSIVTYVPEIGSRIDTNDKQVYSLGENTVFDEAAIRAASATLQQVHPEAGRFLMLSTDAELHQQQNAMFDDPDANLANREFLKSLWKGQGLTHLTWGALSAKEKTAYLDRLLREAVSQGVPRLLKQ